LLPVGWHHGKGGLEPSRFIKLIKSFITTENPENTEKPKINQPLRLKIFSVFSGFSVVILILP
jgi:hypothetical protein